MSDNPFEVLKLDPRASEEQIVQHASLLRQTATDEATLTAVRQAVQVLTGSPEQRRLHALLTHPAPQYEWPSLDRLAAVLRRPPQETPAETTLIALDTEELAELLRPLLAKSLENPSLPFEPPALRETPEEVLRQTLEGLWQVLPYEFLS